MDFVDFDLSKKLKEKGFSCQYPIAMYNELGSFYALYTSADHNPNIKSVLGNREYYDYDDFDDKDYICPTISQVLKWLRERQFILAINPEYFQESKCVAWNCDIWADGNYWDCCRANNSYESAAYAGIEYVLDNLI